MWTEVFVHGPLLPKSPPHQHNVSILRDSRAGEEYHKSPLTTPWWQERRRWPSPGWRRITRDGHLSAAHKSAISTISTISTIMGEFTTENANERPSVAPEQSGDSEVHVAAQVLWSHIKSLHSIHLLTRSFLYYRPGLFTHIKRSIICLKDRYSWEIDRPN